MLKGDEGEGGGLEMGRRACWRMRKVERGRGAR